MKRMPVLVVIVISLMGMTGCGAGQFGSPPKLLSGDDFATIHIARKGGGWVGCGNAFLIQLNDQDFIRLECGMKASFKIPAGEKIKISQVTSARPDHINLVPEKGEDYYFGMDCNFGACWFDEIDKLEYRKMERTCDKELKISDALQTLEKQAEKPKPDPEEISRASKSITPQQTCAKMGMSFNAMTGKCY